MWLHSLIIIKSLDAKRLNQLPKAPPPGSGEVIVPRPATSLLRCVFLITILCCVILSNIEALLSDRLIHEWDLSWPSVQDSTVRHIPVLPHVNASLLSVCSWCAWLITWSEAVDMASSLPSRPVCAQILPPAEGFVARVVSLQAHPNLFFQCSSNINLVSGNISAQLLDKLALVASIEPQLTRIVGLMEGQGHQSAYSPPQKVRDIFTLVFNGFFQNTSSHSTCWGFSDEPVLAPFSSSGWFLWSPWQQFCHYLI